MQTIFLNAFTLCKYNKKIFSLTFCEEHLKHFNGKELTKCQCKIKFTTGVTQNNRLKRDIYRRS